MRRVAVVAAVALVLVAPPAHAKTKRWPPLPYLPSDLSWSDCGDGFQCGRLTVPVDWRAPHGDTLTLALIRRPAGSPGERVGSLVVNYGGPGVAGTDYLRATWRRLPDPVKARFDLVSWDPRGVGGSRPADCVDDAFLDLGDRLDPIPGTTAAWDALHRYNAAFARGCSERMGAYAGAIGTRNTARDLEAIRRALGEPTITYLGYSYGTLVGITYAQMFPEGIRAMVLDAPADWWLPPLEYAHAQAKGFANALDAFLAWCEQHACGVTRDGFFKLFDDVRRQPLSAAYMLGSALRQGVLTGSDFETAVLAMLYDEGRGWPILGNALRAAAQDGWGGPLLAIADQFVGRAVDGTWSTLVEANAVISCVDRPETEHRTDAQERADFARFQSELPPFGGEWAVSTCAGMPRPTRGDELGDVRVSRVPPVLVVGTTSDPATPYAGALNFVSRIRGSGLLSYDSTEHTAYGSGRSTCVDDAVDRYLFDVVLPPAGTHCTPG